MKKPTQRSAPKRTSKKRVTKNSKKTTHKRLAIPSRDAWYESKALTMKRAPKRKTTADYEKARDAYYKYGRGILKRLGPRGVVGLSYGPRLKNDIPQEAEITIRVHVATKKAKKELRKNAKKWGLHKTYGGVGVDIVVWDFKTSTAPGHGQQYSNGARIDRGDAFGTLGTKVVIDVGTNNQKGMWITAAHLVSLTGAPPVPPAVIIHNGSPIGTVSAINHFREARWDIAFIEPSSSISPLTSSRVISPLFSSDKGASVVKDGAATNTTTGTIKLLDYDGTIESPANDFETVVDHFLVEGTNGKFAAVGDSGALVVKDDGSFIGIVRAAGQPSGIGVITRLSVIANNARGFEL